MDSIRLGTSGYVQLTFTDELTGNAITTATVTAKIYKEQSGADTQLGSTITMSHVSGGVYRGSIPYDLSGLEVGLKLRVEIFADAGSGKRLTIQHKVTVRSDS